MKHLVKLAMEGQLDTVPTLSMEELNELENQAEKTQADVALDLDEAEKAMSVVGALEDLAFVASEIEEVSPREAALIQIAADATLINTGVDSSAIFPAMESISNGKSVADRIAEVIKRIVAAVRVLFAKIKKSIEAYNNANLQIALQRKKQIKTLLAQFKRTDFSAGKSNIECSPLYTVDGDGNPNTLTKTKDMIDELRALVAVNRYYIPHAGETIKDISTICRAFYEKVTDMDKEKASKFALTLAGQQNIQWMGKLPNGAAVEDGFEASDLMMGLRLIGTVDSDTYKEGIGAIQTSEDLATVFSKCIGKFSLQASVYSVTVDSEKMSTPSSRDIREMLMLADQITDACLDSGETLLTAMKSATEHIAERCNAITKLAEGVPALIKKDKDKADFIVPHVRAIENLNNKLASLPHKAFSAVIGANLRTVTKVLQIAQKSMHAYDNAEK